MTDISIQTEYIKLESLLKFAGLCTTGGEAKNVIQDNLVYYNGEICKMRGKKVRAGDVVVYNGSQITVTQA